MTDVDLEAIIESVIPSWNRAEFHFLEPTPMWAPSVQSELQRLTHAAVQSSDSTDFGRCSEVHCHSHPTTRSIFEQIKNERCDGVVLFGKDHMRDVLLCLGRLTRLCRKSPPVLVIIPPEALTLMPLLLESGATGVICQPVQDIQVAEWCRRVVSADR